MPRNTRRLLKRRRNDDELLEILAKPLGVGHYRRQLAWMKQEHLRRIHPNNDGYVAFSEENAGVALEDAEGFMAEPRLKRRVG